MSRVVEVVGGGPAGAAAALEALGGGAQVRIWEKSAFPRHKVCGEFLSPAIATLLGEFGCLARFHALRPAFIGRLELHFGRRVVRRNLPQPAYGLSRYALDHLLLSYAQERGAALLRGQRSGTPPAQSKGALVVASGRKAVAPAGGRLFGFKAHFAGPGDDAVALHFFDSCYVGVSAVENGATNVCGLAPEEALREGGFDPARLLARCPALAERLAPLELTMDWLVTGPLVLSERLREPGSGHVYLAGDALGFIDPFTGSGILNAMLTGRLAGAAAARALPVAEYHTQCRALLRRPFLVSALFRAAIGTGLAGPLAALSPGRWLFHATRPAWQPRRDA